jgi:PPOX class probable F420-dependent enzyme
VTGESARAALARARVARLATVGSDGRPHLVPICFALDGERIYTAVDHKPKTGRLLQRLENIAANTAVSVLADHYEDGDWSALWWVRVDGAARVIAPGDGDHARAVELLARRYRQYVERPPAGEVIEIEVERWSGWGALPGADRSALAPAISHIDLVVGSLERSLPFYRALLEPIGWTGLRSITGERGESIHYLSIPGRSGSLGLRERQSDAHGVPYDRYAVGVHHVCFDVATREVIEERFAWLRSVGARIESPPREYDYTPGYYAVFFYDLDGIKLELLHRPPLLG